MQKSKLMIGLVALCAGTLLASGTMVPSAKAQGKGNEKAKNTAGNSMTIQNLESGGDSGITEKETAVVRTQAEWDALWKRHTCNVAPPPTAPKVDFNSDMVIAVFSGSKKSGGYAIEITRVKEAGNKIMVDFKETKPPASAIVSMGFTQPFHMVKVKKSATPVVFQGN